MVEILGIDEFADAFLVEVCRSFILLTNSCYGCGQSVAIRVFDHPSARLLWLLGLLAARA